MNVRDNQPAQKRPAKANSRTSKLQMPGAEWESADDQLDEALRQTFPASDALSIVQSARR
jgi:hypothetical protein